jgi:hypothetical protein
MPNSPKSPEGDLPFDFLNMTKLLFGVLSNNHGESKRLSPSRIPYRTSTGCWRELQTTTDIYFLGSPLSGDLGADHSSSSGL